MWYQVSYFFPPNKLHRLFILTFGFTITLDIVFTDGVDVVAPLMYSTFNAFRIGSPGCQFGASFGPIPSSIPFDFLLLLLHLDVVVVVFFDSEHRWLPFRFVLSKSVTPTTLEDRLGSDDLFIAEFILYTSVCTTIAFWMKPYWKMN